MSFKTSRRVEFCDTDAAGIAHFAAFFPMMESAEHELLRSLGISVMPRPGSGSSLPDVTWPRVSAHCDYTAAAKFEDVLEIDVRVEKIGKSSVTYHFRFRRDETPIAEGRLTAVCCRLRSHGVSPSGGDSTGSPLEKTEIPDAIRELLARHH